MTESHDWLTVPISLAEWQWTVAGKGTVLVLWFLEDQCLGFGEI